ncbi:MULTISPECIES: CU044_2847 family protein [Streptomycetaceae]|uniref:CU044_2847 family protein n=1 Tax=Streptomycetaceae TaxID=2062 RepID=UPI000213FC87|nr:CU044_2847 family protein [Streptantibioticus cattleyicolor]MYS61672.1 hypothetical protein [Streptomyces sp. SID5468]CCB77540.1 conserved protein of unknown function [Streptantibioticus cattleyicolor NRRL 8057 = DSM 46488]
MPQYAEIHLAPDTAVRLELAPVGEPPVTPDLPAGIAGSAPVGHGSAGVAAFASDALRRALTPLGPLLQQVHDSVTATADPPSEITVQFGVQIGQDLKLGIVGAAGQASMTVSATWQIEPQSE